jgi:hypothetical protein
MREEWKAEHSAREEVWLLRQLLWEARQQTDLLRSIDDKLLSQVTGFTIQQTGDSTMAFQAPDPGNTLQFTATPTPVALPSGVVPTWSSSDTTNVSISTDPTGLIAEVVLGSAIPVGELVTLKVSATLPDGTTPSGSITFTIDSATPPVEATGFTIAQTA